MRYRELYRYGAECLREADIPEAELDARLLLESVCHTDRNTLLAHGDMAVEAGQEACYREWIRKRGGHIPLQYITGTQDFMGLTFQVDESVLIPRQDTELLVEEAMRELHDGMGILDMCTGSGCILLSLLHYSNDCEGLGVDISREALQAARRNAEALCLSAEFLQSDLFTEMDRDRKFDILVSNPPYIPSGVIPTLMEEVCMHEPHAALDGRADGLHFYREIGRGARPFLYRGAFVLFEIGYDQADAVSGILEEEGYKEIEVIKDFAGLDRVVKCIFPG